MKKLQRIRQQVIRKDHPKYNTIDEMCLKSKNLYNEANYRIRQEFINNGKYIKYTDLNKSMKVEKVYKECMSQPANCTLRLLDKNWKSYFAAIKDWNKHKEKYSGMPKIPKYLKKNGRFNWMIPNNTCYLNEDGMLRFKMKLLNDFDWNMHVPGRLVQVRFVPNGSCYIMEAVYEVSIQNNLDKNMDRVASIDLGVNNLVTMVNNIGERPIIINGRIIKSINQFYNKRRSKLQSNLMKSNGQYWSRQLDVITFKRYQRIKNYMHHASKYIVNWCIENDIDTLIVGVDRKVKQNINLGKVNNQIFVDIPHIMLVNQLKYKCEESGIHMIETEESYTSGTSFLDGEMPNEQSYNKKRRIHRGLFKSENMLVNADVNAAFQIMRKVIPNVNDYGIEAYLTPVIINATA